MSPVGIYITQTGPLKCQNAEYPFKYTILAIREKNLHKIIFVRFGESFESQFTPFYTGFEISPPTCSLSEFALINYCQHGCRGTLHVRALPWLLSVARVISQTSIPIS